MLLTDKQHIEMLEKLLALIESGEPLKLEDSDVTGDKYTHANWGQCTDKGWSEDALFNKNNPSLGHKYLAKGQLCPFDKKDGAKLRNSPDGCYYRCRLFQGPVPNREEAIQLYQIRLKELKGD